MTDDEVDRLAKWCADFVKAGGKLEVKVDRRCRKCGKGEYRHHGSPNWMNRFTCTECGHNVSM